MINIIYREDSPLPDELHKKFSRILDHYKTLLPSWVAQVYITYDRDLKSKAECWFNFMYMTLNIRIGDPWFSMSLQECSDTLVHELMHAYTTPMYNDMQKHLDRLKLDEVHRKMLDDILEEKLEMATEGLTRMVRKIMADNLEGMTRAERSVMNL